MTDNTDIDWTRTEIDVPPRKRPLSIRLDRDVLAFFKAGGPGWQTRMNAVLRAWVLHRKAQAIRRRKA